MKTAQTPLAVVGAKGARLKLADGRELIDGVASWWTVAHGYNHPHIREAVARQLETLPHVMLGGLAHEQAYTLAKRLANIAARRSEPRVLLGLRLGRRRSRAEDGDPIPHQPRRTRPHENAELQGRLSRRHLRHDGDLRSRRRHAQPLQRRARRTIRRRPAVRPPEDAKRSTASSTATPKRSQPSSSNRWCKAPAGMKFHSTETLRRIADAARRHDMVLDPRRNLHRLRPHRHDVRDGASRHRPRHRLPRQSPHRRHAAARGNSRKRPHLRRLSLRRSRSAR